MRFCNSCSCEIVNYMNLRPICAQCDELLLDLEIECAEDANGEQPVDRRQPWKPETPASDSAGRSKKQKR